MSNKDIDVTPEILTNQAAKVIVVSISPEVTLRFIPSAARWFAQQLIAAADSLDPP